jgi:Ca2+-dependent lipid-binding protein
VNESLNPVWNQTFEFVVEDGLHDMLMLEVYDHDTFSRVSSTGKFSSYIRITR